MVRGRLRPDHHEPQRHDGLRARDQPDRPERRVHVEPTTSRTTSRSSTTRRTANPTHLRPSSVTAHRQHARGRRQDDGPGQPPVRQPRLLRRAAGRQLPGRQLPQGAGLPGRSPGLLRPGRRAGVHRRGHHGACSRAATGSTTAIVITYDDSDGWYDHQAPPIVNPSATRHGRAQRRGRRATSGAQQGTAARADDAAAQRPTTAGRPRRDAAATARASRSWSSRPSRRRTTSTTR